MKDPVRKRIVGSTRGSLNETIYAGAGAGTGKTQALVERIANLIALDVAKPENIAAVTFTVSAASELRQRVREELEKRLEDSDKQAKDTDDNYLSRALKSLDSAFIGTIHSFAQSLLRERPLEAGLPPVFELNDEAQSQSVFDEQWNAWLDKALGHPELAQAVVNAQQLGLREPLTKLKDLARELHANYDMIERVGLVPVPGQSIEPRVELESIRSDLKAALVMREHCINPDDRMLVHLNSNIRPAVSWIEEGLYNPLDQEIFIALTQLPRMSFAYGRNGDWSSLSGGKGSLEEIRKLLKAAEKRRGLARQALGQATVTPLVNAVSKWVLEYAEKRRMDGLLEFQDLLVLSCRLVSQSREARTDFQSRYTHVLIDEFQDTDPLQLRLAAMLTDRSGTGSPTAGSLFVVGDAKQSIYRFRRADLAQLQTLVDSTGATSLSMKDNYRSHPGILNWVNAVFAPWMNGLDGLGSNVNQAHYVPLKPGKTDYPVSVIPRVMITGKDAAEKVDDARASEAEDIATLAADIGAGKWSLPGDENGMRASEFRDLCVLMPRRTGLATLEEALVTHEVPYILEGRAPIFESQAVHDLINSLIAIDDPTDQVAIVASLKSTAWGCSDQDLYDWANSGRKFEYAFTRHKPDEFAPESGEKKVAEALDGLSEFHDRRQEQSTPYLIEQFIRQRRLRELGELSSAGSDHLRLMDLLMEISRFLQRSGTGSLREFVRWVTRQTEANVRIAEGALSSSEINGVRVMTIHAAKGLEFPIVALTGLQVGGVPTKDNSIIKEKRGEPVIAVKLGSKELGLSTPNYQDMSVSEREADAAESVRLAYVGATRARDHLIVSLHRTVEDKSTLASQLSEFNDLAEGLWFPLVSQTGRAHLSNREISSIDRLSSGAFSLAERSKWKTETEEAVSNASDRGYLTPSQLADHSMFAAPKPEDNAGETEWNTARKGRGGTDLGSAVHSVLQDLYSDESSELSMLVNRAAEAYSVSDESSSVARLVQNVLESPTVAGSTAENSWREVWIAAEIAKGVEIEGSIDLLISNDDETFTIVDYKTDRVTGGDLVSRAKGYEPQLACYALALETLGLTVDSAVLIFADGADDGSAFEYMIQDLEAAKGSVLDQANKAFA